MTAADARKWFATVSICAALGGLAINLAIPGPCLLQIRAVTDSSITNIALIFPIMSVGRLVGSVPTGIWKCGRYRGMVLGLLILLTSLTQAAVPWLNHLLLMLLSFFIMGFADGYLDAESNNIIKGMWRSRDESFLVAARTSMIVGFAVGPFLSLPFVETPPTVVTSPTLMTSPTMTSQRALIPTPGMRLDTKTINNISDDELILSMRMFSSWRKLQSLYMITSIILFVLAFCVGVSVWLAQPDIQQSSEDENQNEEEPKSKMEIQWTSLTRVLISIFLCVIAFCSNSINLSYIDFIATFVVVYLGRSAREGAFVTVICCACAVVGSIVPIFLVRYFRATWLVGVCLSISSVSAVLLASGAWVIQITWLGSALLGIASFAIYALMFVVADELIGLTNRISALLVAVSAIGEIVMSFTAGRLFEPNPMNLMYILLAAFLLSDTCYIGTLILAKRQKDLMSTYLEIEQTGSTAGGSTERGALLEHQPET